MKEEYSLRALYVRGSTILKNKPIAPFGIYGLFFTCGETKGRG
jgi:hypothetical protein